ncbi:hypothetical protein CK203_057318 [Vitis vinifera]|uniref:Uncharacterized protein n=1 Tax=Vitis vinifera TaxID=29760 RepID=A0A438GKK5_VITVI|nr:hypothetical protein CK203_057318 [Vitis vinifera]
MASVGELFYTCRSPSHGSTISAPTARAGRVPAETALPMPTLEATSVAPPTASNIPLIAPTTSEPSITISSSEFRAMNKQTAILCQIQQHLGLLPPTKPDLPASSAPIAPTEDTTPTKVRIPPP